jgi:hypothetical protein
MPAILWYATFTGNDPMKNPNFSDTERSSPGLMLKGAEDGGYLEIQRTRPQPSVIFNDSPIGQLTWIAEKFKFWTATGEKLLKRLETWIRC